MSDNVPHAEWEERYGGSFMWTGKVNAHLQEWLEKHPQMQAGTAIDLGCGEGADAMWLASHGWHVTGVDFARAAIDRARAEALARGVDVTWDVADLTRWEAPVPADLVTVSFLHEAAPVRIAVWRAAARAVAPSGTLLVTGHAPDVEGAPGPPLQSRFTADEVRGVLGDGWHPQVRALRRDGTGRHAGHVVTDLVMSFTRS